MKRLSAVSLVLAIMVVMLVGCANCYKKMQKNLDAVQVSCNPEVLTLKGNNVTADITVTFPAKYFDQLAVMKLTPVLVYEGGEIVGTPKFVQGEDVEDNYTVIPYKAGGQYKQTVTFPYKKEAALSTLEVRIETKCADECSAKLAEFTPFAALAVAQGISTTQNLANDGTYAIMPDNFSRVTTITKDADIHYIVNLYNVRKDQMQQQDVKDFEAFVKENSGKEKVTLDKIYSKGYASPEGPLNFNDKLSKNRSESGETAIEKELKELALQYDAAAYGEDWEGFQKMVEASNIQDKDLILNVLKMYSSPVKRDEEIRSMSSVFDQLKKDILPALRRTQLSANADIEGMSDAELLAAAKSGDKNLTVEEMLYAATLTNDNALKAKIYKMAADTYNDVRAWNNLAVAEAAEGNLNDAKAALKKAQALGASSEITNNLAAVSIAEGDYAQAKQYLANLNTEAAKANKGLVSLAEGEYANAASTLTGYNKAVAEVCNNNLSAAKQALQGCTGADVDYLKAVIAAKEGDVSSAVANLKAAIAVDPSLKAQAQNDVNFAKIVGTSEFLAL